LRRIRPKNWTQRAQRKHRCEHVTKQDSRLSSMSRNAQSLSGASKKPTTLLHGLQSGRILAAVAASQGDLQPLLQFLHDKTQEDRSVCGCSAPHFRRPFTVMVAVIGIAFARFSLLREMPIDIFPNLNLPVVYVAQPYGACPPRRWKAILSTTTISLPLHHGD